MQQQEEFTTKVGLNCSRYCEQQTLEVRIDWIHAREREKLYQTASCSRDGQAWGAKENPVILLLIYNNHHLLVWHQPGPPLVNQHFYQRSRVYGFRTDADQCALGHRVALIDLYFEIYCWKKPHAIDPSNTFGMFFLALRGSEM